jgi:hypothetical protein
MRTDTATSLLILEEGRDANVSCDLRMSVCAAQLSFLSLTMFMLATPLLPSATAANAPPWHIWAASVVSEEGRVGENDGGELFRFVLEVMTEEARRTIVDRQRSLFDTVDEREAGSRLSGEFRDRLRGERSDGASGPKAQLFLVPTRIENDVLGIEQRRQAAELEGGR